MKIRFVRHFAAAAALLPCLGNSAVEAGEPVRSPAQLAQACPPVQVVRARPIAVPYQPLGTFDPSPYVMLPSPGIAGAGYSPMGIQGAGTLAEYGPASMLRQVSVPVTTYSRGYDGSIQPTTGTTLVYPNMPNVNPINGRAAISFPPSRTTYRPFRSGSGALNWLDQN